MRAVVSIRVAPIRKAAAAPKGTAAGNRRFSLGPTYCWHQLDATILSTAFSRLVGRDEVGLAVPGHPQLGGMDPTIQQVIGDGVATALYRCRS